MLSVGDSIADNRFEEGFEDTTGLFVDHSLNAGLATNSSNQADRTDRNTLDTTTTSKTTNGGFRDTLDVVSKNLAMAFGTTLAEALATFTTCLLGQYHIGRGMRHSSGGKSEVDVWAAGARCGRCYCKVPVWCIGAATPNLR
jgi:hypothetical protein